MLHLLLAIQLLTVPVPGPMFPFQPTHATPDNLTNVATWPCAQPAPAGNAGFIRARDNHFEDDSGERRFLGTNICFTGCFPSHDKAERVAEELTRYGINIVRLHYVHHQFPAGRRYPEKDSFLEPEQLERFDYLFAQLKKRGIYTYFQLNIARKFGIQNGLDTEGLPNFNKGVDQVYPDMVRLNRKYVAEILAHRNPYTGLAYKEEPAIAMLELENENSIVHAWFNKWFHFPQLKDPFGRMLKDRWNGFLRRKYRRTDNLRKAWSTGPGFSWPKDQRLEKGTVAWPMDEQEWKAVPQRAVDLTEFLAETEARYFSDMNAWIKDGVGAPQCVTGTQVHYGFDHPLARTDYIDAHCYWRHPVFEGQAWKGGAWSVGTGALVNARPYPATTLTRLACDRVLGKPFTVSEFDHPNLTPYNAEGLLMAAAFAAYQNWSGLIQFAWSHSDDFFRDVQAPLFDLCSATQKLVHFPACYAMFIRGDVSNGSLDTLCVRRSSLQEDVRAVARKRVASARGGGSLPWTTLPLTRVSGRILSDMPELYDTEGHTIIDSLRTAPAEVRKAAGASRLCSSTGELTWDRSLEDAGYFQVDTRGTKVFTGFVRGRSFRFDGFSLTPGKTLGDWLTLSLTRTDAGKGAGSGRGPLEPGRYLLAVTGACHNTDMVLANPKPDFVSTQAKYGGHPGHAPILCEGIPAALVFDQASALVRCYALDGDGARTAEVPVAATDDGKALLQIGPQFRTVWYEILITK